MEVMRHERRFLCFPYASQIRLRTMKLTKTKIDEFTLPDGKTDHIEWDDELPGFGVRVRESGAKYFVAQYRIGKKQGRQTLGNVAKFNTIDAARKAARTILELAEGGKNPRTVREEAEHKIAQAITPLIGKFLDAKKSGWSESYYGDVERSLKVYFKKLHSKALTEITRPNVSVELATIQTERGDTTRNRAPAHLSAFFNWAIGEGLCEVNPAEKTNKAPETSRDRALSDAELQKLWRCLGADQFSDDERDLIKLMILTLQRENQIGDLKVGEISEDGDRLTWMRARAKNKGFTKHVIPMGPIARDIIAKRQLEGREYVFGRRDTGFANYTHLKEKIDDIVKFNDGWWFHDIRRTGKTTMSEHLDVEHQVSEAILNHGKRGMDKVYNNAEYIDKKRDALAKWEQYVIALLQLEKLAA
jgi:integrase